jgi:N-acetylglucosaminyldiphosphoundecaprenol N-acetyl-beta-D-mannosaminyltransferase
MLQICDEARPRGYRHFFYGGADGIADKLARTLVDQYPGLHIAGTYCPPFRALDDVEQDEIAAKINATHPDIVWVGLGAPKQEKWMAAQLRRIKAPAMIGVGAAFDFHSGNIKWAPRFVRRCGIEWAYRLVVEPRRMWRRNLDSPLFLMHVLAQAGMDRLTGRTRRTSPERRHAAGVALAAELASRLPAGVNEVGSARDDALVPVPVAPGEEESPLVPV